MIQVFSVISLGWTGARAFEKGAGKCPLVRRLGNYFLLITVVSCLCAVGDGEGTGRASGARMSLAFSPGGGEPGTAAAALF